MCWSFAFWVLLRRIKAWIISRESPIITRSWTLWIIAWLSPCQRSSAFVLLLVYVPSPKEKMIFGSPLGLTRTPHPPATPGFPLEAPSKKIVVRYLDFHQFVKLSSDSLNLHSGFAVWGMRRRLQGEGSNGLSHLRSSGRSSGSALKYWCWADSRRRALALTTTCRGVRECSLKIWSFWANHSCQQTYLGIAVQIFLQKDLEGMQRG